MVIVLVAAVSMDFLDLTVKHILWPITACTISVQEALCVHNSQMASIAVNALLDIMVHFASLPIMFAIQILAITAASVVKLVQQLLFVNVRLASQETCANTAPILVMLIHARMEVSVRPYIMAIKTCIHVLA